MNEKKKKEETRTKLYSLPLFSFQLHNNMTAFFVNEDKMENFIIAHTHTERVREREEKYTHACMMMARNKRRV